MISTIILALLFGLVLIFGAAYLSFNGRINREIKSLLSQAKADPGGVITEEMLQNLPPPVQKYMTYSGVVGKAIPRTIRLKQTGRIRQDAKSAWMKLEAQEYYSTNPPGFVWKVFVPTRRFPMTLGWDAYLDGRGSQFEQGLTFLSQHQAPSCPL